MYKQRQPEPRKSPSERSRQSKRLVFRRSMVLMGQPSTVMLPESMRYRFRSVRMRDVLPAPFRPIRPKI